MTGERNTQGQWEGLEGSATRAPVTCIGWVWGFNGSGNGFHQHGGRLVDGMAKSAWEGEGMRQWHGNGRILRPTSRAQRASKEQQ